jgi:hypothetical protein
MSGFNKSNNSLVNGIPTRFIGPETGSSGNATMTNTGGTSEGTNEAFDSDPAPAAGFDAPILTVDSHKKRRSFASHAPEVHEREAASALAPDEEAAAQQIADGGDRIRHDEDEGKSDT